MENNKALLIIALALFFKIPFVHASDSVNVYQMAVTGVPVPSLGVTFTSFSAPTAGDRDTNGDTGQDGYLFVASTSSGNSGVYTYDAYYNNFFDVADTTMTALTGGNFASFSNLSSGLGAVGFIATDTNGVQGVYGIGNVPLTLIATPSSNVGTGTLLGNIQNISISGDLYGTPAGLIESDTGVYSFILGSSPVHSINYGSLTSFGPVSYKGSIGFSLVPGFHLEADAFAATVGSVRGIYYGGPGSDVSFLAVATVGGFAPNNAGIYTSFGNPLVTTNEVTFAAHYTTTGSDDQQGIFVYGPYEDIGNFPHLHQIVATGQIAPDSGGATFTGFSNISDTSFDQTFIATLSDGGEGLFVNVNEGASYSPAPQLLKIAETGDSINGKTVLGFELSPEGSNYYDVTAPPYGSFANNGIGFEVSFTDGSEGLYYFTVNLPEPAFACLLGLPFLFTRRRIVPSPKSRI